MLCCIGVLCPTQKLRSYGDGSLILSLERSGCNSGPLVCKASSTEASVSYFKEAIKRIQNDMCFSELYFMAFLHDFK